MLRSAQCGILSLQDGFEFSRDTGKKVTLHYNLSQDFPSFDSLGSEGYIFHMFLLRIKQSNNPIHPIAVFWVSD